MRKKAYFKKGLACLLSTAMVVTSLVVPVGQGNTVLASEITVPTAVANYDFTSETLPAGMSVDGTTDTGPSNRAEKTEEGIKLTNGFVNLPGNIFDSVDKENISGITVSMKYMKHNSEWPDNQWSEPLFNLSTVDKNAEGASGTTDKSIYCSWNGNIGTGTQLFGNDGAWLDGSLAGRLPIDTWHTVTVTYDIASNTVTDYVDGIKIASGKSDKASLTAEDIKKFAYNVIGRHSDGGWGFWAFCTVQNFSVWAQPLDFKQVYKVVTGKDYVEANRASLTAAIEGVSSVTRPELYKDIEEALAAAQAAQTDFSMKQEEIDKVADTLDKATKTLVKKDVKLEDGIILDLDMTAETSVVDAEKKKITVDEYEITPLGTSEIKDGYIQSSTTGEAGKAGISLDEGVLKDASLEKGLTFNILWNFSKATTADWQDLISILDSKGDYLMRNTLGFITYAGKGNVFPDSDCKNGYAWDSCKNYTTGEAKNLAITIDTTGFRMYVDGVLACEKKDMTAYDFTKVFENAASIVIGQGKNANDGDMQGQLFGIQVYGRALNAAEMEELSKKRVVTAAIKTLPNAKVDVTADGALIQTVTADESGDVVAKELVKGIKYSCTITNDNDTTVTKTFTAGTDASVTVLEPLTGIAFKESEITLESTKVKDKFTPGSKTLPEIVFTPDNTTDDRTVTYTSSPEGAVTVGSDRTVTAVTDAAEATATVTATAAGGKTAVCTVNIKTTYSDDEVLVTEISLDKSDETVEVGKSVQLTATCKPDTATNKKCGWESSDKNVATVDVEGKVTAVGPGEATITATASDGSGKTATCKITVVVPVSGIELNRETVTLKEDRQITLTATVTPNNATDKEVTWASSDPTVAVVDQTGKVTSIKAGNTTITASAGVKNATCVVTVVAADATNTAESLDNTAGWANPSNAGLELLTGDFDVTYKFVIDKVGTDNWSNFVVEMKAGTDDFLDIRADGFAFTNGKNFGSTFATPSTSALKADWSGAPEDWASWLASCPGATVEVRLTRTGDAFEYTAKFSFGTEMKATFSFGEVDVPDDVQLTLLGDHASFSNIVFTDNTPGAHDLTKVDAKPATCTEKGNVEYYHCAICGKNFSDDKATTVIDKVELEMLRHSGDDVRYTDAGGKTVQLDEVKCTEKAYLTGTCTVCGTEFNGNEVMGEKHDYDDGVVTTKASKADVGKITYTCKACESGTDGHTKTDDIDKPSKITLDKTSCVYTGEEIKPEVVKVEDSAGIVIPAADYAVSYSNNKEVGTNAKVIVTFKEDSARYSGNLETTFEITKKADDKKPDDGDKKPDDGDKKPSDGTGDDQTPAATLTLSKTTATLYTGKASNSVTVKPTVIGTSKTVTWKTSNPKVATVKNGKITAVGKGTATITATANGISKTVKVTVKNPTLTIKKGSKKFTKSKLAVKKKKKVTLTVTVSPKNSGISIAKLTAKQKKIASVTLKKGKITIKGKKKGSFTLKIKSGKTTKNIKITVK